MTYPDNIPTFRMSPPQFASSNIDINKVRPQLPMNNEQFEPRSAMDSSHSFKRPRMSDDSKHSNAPMGPPPRMNQHPPNRRPDSIFFKTRICFNFGFGSCRNGEKCSFAHGVEELRRPPPNWQELVRPRTEERRQLGANKNDDQKIIYKMKLYKKYYNGEPCPYGDNCSFLHKDPAKFGDDSWKTRRESSSTSIGTIGNNLEGNKTVTKPPRGTYWKTKPCLKWKHTRSFPFGDDCGFAHGDAVPAGGIEAEAAVAIANSTKVVIPTFPATVPEAKEDEKKTKKHLLWLKLNKINRIYGDWIDD